MKKVIVVVIVGIVLTIVGGFIIQERNSDIMLESNDQSVARIDDETMEVTVIDETTQEELLECLESENRLDLTYEITTNEGNTKQKEALYSYDLLEVDAKGKDMSLTYSIRTVDTFDD